MKCYFISWLWKDDDEEMEIQNSVWKGELSCFIMLKKREADEKHMRDLEFSRERHPLMRPKPIGFTIVSAIQVPESEYMTLEAAIKQ